MMKCEFDRSAMTNIWTLQDDAKQLDGTSGR